MSRDAHKWSGSSDSFEGRSRFHDVAWVPGLLLDHHRNLENFWSRRVARAEVASREGMGIRRILFHHVRRLFLAHCRGRFIQRDVPRTTADYFDGCIVVLPSSGTKTRASHSITQNKTTHHWVILFWWCLLINSKFTKPLKMFSKINRRAVLRHVGRYFFVEILASTFKLKNHAGILSQKCRLPPKVFFAGFSSARTLPTYSPFWYA